MNETSDTPTPRTDKEKWTFQPTPDPEAVATVVDVDFARQLERELTSALALSFDRLRELQECRKERDELQKNSGGWTEAAEWRDKARRAEEELTRLRSVPAAGQWISVKDRMPTKDDADGFGLVLWKVKDSFIPRVETYCYYSVTGEAWMPIPPLPAHDEQDEAEKAWLKSDQSGGTHDAFLRGFAAARKANEPQP